MAEVDRHSKTEAPSQKRRQDARRKGDIATSRDLTNGLGLLTATGTLMLAGHTVGDSLLRMVHEHISFVTTTELTPSVLTMMTRNAFSNMVTILGFFIGVVTLAHIGSTALQSGFQVTFKPLEPDWNRINPVSGMGRLFSGKSLMRGVLALLKIALLGIIVYMTTRQQIHQIGTAALTTVPVAVGLAWEIVLRAGLSVSLALVVAGVLDYGYQRWQHEVQLRMTKQEVKDERKEDEGDPMLKARIKRVQRELSQQRMLGDVGSATVVLTNPTHYAIALKYDLHSMTAPKVVAKGVDEVAKRIREIADEHDVPILERRELARALYRTVEVGDDIPPALYHAIAEIVAYLYRIGKFRAAG